MDTVSKRPEKQPGLAIIKHQTRNIAALARRMGVREYEVRAPLHGEMRPGDTVCELLPLILGVPLEMIFTEDALAAPVRQAEPVA